MDFNNISGFLEKFKNLKPSDTYIKDVFISCVKEIMNVDITKNEITVQRETIFLNVHPTLKTELYLHKKAILKLLQEKLKKYTINNIV